MLDFDFVELYGDVTGKWAYDSTLAAQRRWLMRRDAGSIYFQEPEQDPAEAVEDLPVDAIYPELV